MQNENIIKCPNCGSDKIKRLEGEDDFLHVKPEGEPARKQKNYINKNKYYCLNCRCEWDGDRKYEEIKYSSFFISRLNKHYDLNYIVQPNDKENVSDPEVDIYAISDLKPKLNIQVITREQVLREISAKLRKESMMMMKQNVVMGPAINLETEKWISNAIRKKENHYPVNLKQKLILLITGDIGSLFNENYAKKVFVEFQNTKFKGIYSVHLPSTDPVQSNYIHDGQIIAIKDIFGNHGAIF